MLKRVLQMFLKEKFWTAVDDEGDVKITLSETPVTGTVTVFPLSSDAVAGEEDITVTGSDVTITTGTAGTQYVAYYQFESDSNAEKISFKAKNFPKYCRIVGDTY